MALPAGRRGVRADLVNYDGSINGLEDLADVEEDLADVQEDLTEVNTALTSKANASNLTTVESSTTASQAYSAGEYLILDGQFYEVTADVDIGDTLVVGTNISAKTVGEVLTALNAGLTNLSYSRTGLSVSGGTIIGGGYFKIGNLVVINIRVTVSSAGAAISGFPATAISENANIVGGTAYDAANERAGFYYMNNGTIFFPAVLGAGGSYLISLVYAAQS